MGVEEMRPVWIIGIVLAIVIIIAAFVIAVNDSKSGNGGGAETLRVEASDGTRTIVFELNDSPASKSFVGMMPFSATVSDYSTNEKVFDPPARLSTSDGIQEACPAGSIAYFSPWGNVAMYYGDAPPYAGLYLMGHAVEGGEHIGSLAGTVDFKRVRCLISAIR